MPRKPFAVCPSVTGKSEMRVYRTWRKGGVRIQIVLTSGEVVFDTDDCFDMANAVNKADLWAQKHREHL